jgi:hypothetical protein
MATLRNTVIALLRLDGHTNIAAALRKRLKNLPWKQIPVLDTSTEHGHGRTAKRVLRATEIAEGIGFPGAIQVLQLTRTVTARKTGKRALPVLECIDPLGEVAAVQ